MGFRVAGVDPGTIRTGVGIIERDGNNRYLLTHLETITTNPKHALPQRLRTIHAGLKELFTIYRPEVVAIESVFFCKDFTAAVKIGEARAVAMLAAMDLNIAVEEYMPNRVKQSVCGNGHAAKSQVQFMVQKMLGLKEIPPPDSADALAIAICHLNQTGANRASRRLTIVRG